MRRLALVLAGFVGMEGVSYAAHRWWMHGRGMAWHRSHHPPAGHGFEKNDLFPAIGATCAVLMFTAAAVKPRCAPLRWLGVGLTTYGVSYAMVHDVFVHRRVAIPLPASRYLDWLTDSHRIHHLFGGEPYGMLLPVVPAGLRRRAAASSRQPWPERSTMREARMRL